MSMIVPMEGYGRRRRSARKARKVRNMARHVAAGFYAMGMKHKMRRGGFAPALAGVVAGAQAAHKFFQQQKPISFLLDHGPNLGSSPVANGIRKVGNFLKNTLGYGRKKHRTGKRGRRARILYLK